MFVKKHLGIDFLFRLVVTKCVDTPFWGPGEARVLPGWQMNVNVNVARLVCEA